MSIRLEVGKTYITRDGKKVKIVHKSSCDEEKPFLGVYVSKCYKYELSYWFAYDGAGGVDLIVKEYKEPVIHKRDVIWWKFSNGDITFGVYPHGYKLTHPNKELKRETIEYVEEF